MNNILKVFLLNSQYLFTFIEERYLTKEDVINFMNINSKIKKEILSYYERSFKLEFPNLIKIKNKDYLTLFINFKLSKIPKNVISCIDLDLKLSFSERIIFISPNIEFTDENFQLSPFFYSNDVKKSFCVQKDFFVNNRQDIFRKEISEIHKKIYKMSIFFDYSQFDKNYKSIYENFGYYPFNLTKFKNLELGDPLSYFFQTIEKIPRNINSFNWDCFSKDGLRVISENLLVRINQTKVFQEGVNNALKNFNIIENFEKIMDTLECEEQIFFEK